MGSGLGGCAEESRALQSSEQHSLSYGTDHSSLSGRRAQKGEHIEEEAPESDELIPLVPGGHYPFLDFTRIACVWCVAVDHGNSSFGHWNIMFTQDWVLQYLFLVCGVSYGMTSRHLGGYLKRMFGYFLIGVIVNWIAWLIAGLDWEKNIFNVVFQFWFVVGVMIYATALLPLKWHLQRFRERALRYVSAANPSCPAASYPETEDPKVEEMTAESKAVPRSWWGGGQDTSMSSIRDSNLMNLGAIGGGVLAIVILFSVVMRPLIKRFAPLSGLFFAHFGTGADFWGLPSDADEAKTFFQLFCTYLMSTCTNIYLIAVGPLFLKHQSITTWLVLLNTYIHKAFFYRAQNERFFHGFDLMMIGMSCYYLGLRHRRVIGKYVVRYWFVVLLVCALVWPPDAHERFDEHPPEDTYLRMRVNLLEGIFVVIWLAAGERLVQPEVFTEDHLGFLNSWALVVFLVHKAVHITLFPPLNWTVLVALAPACYLVQLFWK